MSSRAELVIDGIAAWRITHLIVADEFPPVARARDALLDRFGPDHPASYLLTCTFCMGAWVGLGVAAARKVGGSRWDGLACAIATAAAAPIIEELIGR